MLLRGGCADASAVVPARCAVLRRLGFGLPPITFARVAHARKRLCVSGVIAMRHMSHDHAETSSIRARDVPQETQHTSTNLITRHTQPLDALPQRSSTCKFRRTPMHITAACLRLQHCAPCRTAAVESGWQRWRRGDARSGRAFERETQPKIGIYIEI